MRKGIIGRNDAFHTRIAEKTLRNWRYKGDYPQIFMKLGGKVSVNLDDLAKIITEQQEEAKKTAFRHDF